MFRKILATIGAVAIMSSSANAMTIGYFDSTREVYGFSDGGPYLYSAKQWLVNQGHTLVSTPVADAAFLSSVDAFYTGLIENVSGAEATAMRDFVDNQGGFLFVQTDWAGALAPWTSAVNNILSSWGIAHGGNYYNDSGHSTAGSSSWVTTPNAVTGFKGRNHSAVTSAPIGFDVLARDDAGRTILGVIDAGGGRSGDVLVATDINFWDTSYGWSDSRNRALWENIWQSAATQAGRADNVVPEPGTFILMGAGLAGAVVFRKRFVRQI